MDSKVTWIAIAVVAFVAIAVIGVSAVLSTGIGGAETVAVPTVGEEPAPEPSKKAGKGAAPIEGTWTLEDGTEVAFTGENPAQEECMRDVCRRARSDANIDMCRRRECRLQGDRMALAASNAALAGGVFSVDLQLSGTSPKYGPYEPESVLVGVTLTKADGTTLDLEAMSLTATALESGAKFEGKDAGEGWTGYLVAVWGRKKTPCTTTNDGCQRFGYALEHPIASFPAEAFTTAKLPFQSL